MVDWGERGQAFESIVSRLSTTSSSLPSYAVEARSTVRARLKLTRRLRTLQRSTELNLTVTLDDVTGSSGGNGECGIEADPRRYCGTLAVSAPTVIIAVAAAAAAATAVAVLVDCGPFIVSRACVRLAPPDEIMVSSACPLLSKVVCIVL